MDTKFAPRGVVNEQVFVDGDEVWHREVVKTECPINAVPCLCEHPPIKKSCGQSFEQTRTRMGFGLVQYLTRRAQTSPTFGISPIHENFRRNKPE
jgi:hypothetical protein